MQKRVVAMLICFCVCQPFYIRTSDEHRGRPRSSSSGWLLPKSISDISTTENRESKTENREPSPTPSYTRIPLHGSSTPKTLTSVTLNPQADRIQELEKQLGDQKALLQSYINHQTATNARLQHIDETQRTHEQQLNEQHEASIAALRSATADAEYIQMLQRTSAQKEDVDRAVEWMAEIEYEHKELKKAHDTDHTSLTALREAHCEHYAAMQNQMGEYNIKYNALAEQLASLAECLKKVFTATKQIDGNHVVLTDAHNKTVPLPALLQQFVQQQAALQEQQKVAAQKSWYQSASNTIISSSLLVTGLWYGKLMLPLFASSMPPLIHANTMMVAPYLYAPAALLFAGNVIADICAAYKQAQVKPRNLFSHAMVAGKALLNNCYTIGKSLVFTAGAINMLLMVGIGSAMMAGNQHV